MTMHTETYCETLENLDPAQAIRAIHEAWLQLSAAARDTERALDHSGAILSLEKCLEQAGHFAFGTIQS